MKRREVTAVTISLKKDHISVLGRSPAGALVYFRGLWIVEKRGGLKKHFLILNAKEVLRGISGTV